MSIPVTTQFAAHVMDTFTARLREMFPDAKIEDGEGKVIADMATTVLDAILEKLGGSGSSAPIAVGIAVALVSLTNQLEQHGYDKGPNAEGAVAIARVLMEGFESHPVETDRKHMN